MKRQRITAAGLALAVLLARGAFLLWNAKDLPSRGEMQQAQDCPPDQPTRTPWPEQATLTPRPIYTPNPTYTPVAPTPTNTPTATPTCEPTATLAPNPSPTAYPESTPYPTHTPYPLGTPLPAPTDTPEPAPTDTPGPTPTLPPGEIKHLAPGGGSGGDGSEGDPWRSMETAAISTQPGDVVLIEDGTYLIGGGVMVFNNGTESQPITFRAVNPGQAIMLKSANDGAMFDLRTHSHLRFEGIVLDGDYDARGWIAWRGIHMDNTHDIVFRDCAIQNLDGRAAYSSGNSQDILFENCEVNLGWYSDGNSHDGFLIYGAGNARIEIVGCLIYNIDHVGIDLYGCEDCEIRDNEIHTSHSHLVQLGSGEGTGWPISAVVTGNVLHGSETFGPSNSQYHNGIYITSGDIGAVIIAFNYIYNLDGSGIHIGNPVVGPVAVYNNTIYGANHQGQRDRAGIFAYSENSPVIDIYNNIVVSTQSAGLTFRVSSGANNNLLANYNLYFSEPGATTTVYRHGTTYGTYVDYAASGLEPDSLIGVDPLFVAPEDGDFRLQGTSPAIGAGDDYSCIGAHQTE